MAVAVKGSTVRLTVLLALITVMLRTTDLGAQTTTFEYEALILHPPGLRNSQAVKINRVTHEVVGSSWTNAMGDGHALLWTGAGTRVLSLNPGSAFGSLANGIFDSQIGGTVSTLATPHSNQATAWGTYTQTSTSLHPTNMAESAIFDSGGGMFVGWAGGQPTSYTQHAMMWTSAESSAVIDLNPRQLSFVDSVANGIDQAGRQQVGSGHIFLGIDGDTIRYSDQHALLWSGNAASAVDLQPSGFDSSYANAVAESIQVGSGVRTAGRNRHALMWTGTANSALDLNPTGFTESAAGGVGFGGVVVGGGWGLSTQNQFHALLWRGNANHFVDLHPFLPAGYESSVASAIDENGNVAGWATTTGGDQHAILWRRKPDLHSIWLPGSYSIYGGGYASLLVVLNGPAIGDALIELSSSNPAVAIVPTVRTDVGILAGTIIPSASQTVNDGIRIVPVATQTPVTITATYRGVSVSATLTVMPARLSSVSLSPAKVVCGQSSTATIVLNAQAPAGGAAIQLAGSTGAASWPRSVTVPEYTDRVSFSVRVNGTGTSASTISGTDTVTATYQSVSRQATVQCKN